MHVHAVINRPHIADWFFTVKLSDFLEQWLYEVLEAAYQEVRDHLTPIRCCSHLFSIGNLVWKHDFCFCKLLYLCVINNSTLDTYSIGLKNHLI